MYCLKENFDFQVFAPQDIVKCRSTDSNLRLWDVSSGKCIRTMKGHQNERNFVGLATDGKHIICGKIF